MLMYLTLVGVMCVPASGPLHVFGPGASLCCVVRVLVPSTRLPTMAGVLKKARSTSEGQVYGPQAKPRDP